MSKKLKINNVLNIVLALNAVQYSDSSSNNEDIKYIGLIAQELQKDYPELVTKNENGYLAIDYARFTAVLVQALKEQQFLIDQQHQNNEKQQYEIDYLKEELKQLKSKKE